MSGLAIVLAFLLLALSAAAGPAQSGESATYKITDDRRRVVGDIYDPGHGRRLQIRDGHRRIIGYIEADGDITDTRRRPLGRRGNPKPKSR